MIKDLLDKISRNKVEAASGGFNPVAYTPVMDNVAVSDGIITEVGLTPTEAASQIPTWRTGRVPDDMDLTDGLPAATVNRASTDSNPVKSWIEGHVQSGFDSNDGLRKLRAENGELHFRQEFMQFVAKFGRSYS